MKFIALIVICAIIITYARHHRHKSWHHQHKSWHHQPAAEDFQRSSNFGASSKVIRGKERRFFSYCELRAIIEKEGWMEQNIKDWMCLLWEESRYEKNVTGHRNDDGSWDYGPFQCSEKWFCRGEHWGNFHFLKKKNKN